MPVILSRILLFLQRIWSVTKAYIPALAAVGATTVARAVVFAAVQIAVLTAWGVFLGAVFTGMIGMGLREVINSNPLAGAPAGALALADACFPFQFAFGLYIAFLVWGFTSIYLAVVMSRVIKYLPGA
ncbi:MAG TPA: hypothetical protein VHG71_06560 [Verrucomicrobiae bacterium]|nr:hypothetical protein [Verrucomicrobiae bacterium]